jgi:hypothetical protein
LLLEVLENKMGTAELYPAEWTSPQKLNIRIMIANSLRDQALNIPSFLIANSLRNFERAFNVSSASCNVSFLDDHKEPAVIDVSASTNSNDAVMSMNNASN